MAYYEDGNSENPKVYFKQTNKQTNKIGFRYFHLNSIHVLTYNSHTHL